MPVAAEILHVREARGWGPSPPSALPPRLLPLSALSGDESRDCVDPRAAALTERSKTLVAPVRVISLTPHHSFRSVQAARSVQKQALISYCTVTSRPHHHVETRRVLLSSNRISRQHSHRRALSAAARGQRHPSSCIHHHHRHTCAHTKRTTPRPASYCGQSDNGMLRTCGWMRSVRTRKERESILNPSAPVIV